MTQTGLHIGTRANGKNFILPDELVTRTQAILAIRGAGKTYTALVQMEEMLERKHQAIALDPTGVWWGLRSSADGKHAGFPVLVFGGDHGDVPLEPTAGALIADFLVDSGRSAVLDLSAFESNSAQDRFAADFAERLYRRKGKSRSPMHLFLDEADSFAPQRPIPGQQRMLGAFEAIVRRGRSRGLGITLISQRAAVLNKNVLTQVELLTCLRVSGPQDQAAILAWVELHGDENRRKTMMSSLAALEKGSAWFWSPGWLGCFERVSIRRRTTFDSSSTPETGQTSAQPKALAEVNLDDLSSQIKATKERAEANDPAKLRRRVADLERELAKAQTTTREKRVEVPVLKPAELKAVEKCSADVREAIQKLQAAGGSIERAICAAHLGVSVTPRPLEQPRVSTAQPPDVASRVGRGTRFPHERPAHEGNGRQLGRAERSILGVLATHGACNKSKLAILAGYAVNGGGFNNALSAVRNAMPSPLVTSSGDWFEITEAGRDANPGETLPSAGPELLDYWCRRLGRAQREILSVLSAAGSVTLGRDAIAERTPSRYAPNGGGFNNAISRLRTLGLVRGSKDGLRISEELL